MIDDPRIEVHALGWIEDKRQKALAYAAADALLHPAPADNFPNVVLEAFACGTAAVVIGIKELLFETGRRLVVGGGTAGELTRKLNSELHGIQFGRGLQGIA